jgi:soluble lytic murein transglycosylase
MTPDKESARVTGRPPSSTVVVWLLAGAAFVITAHTWTGEPQQLRPLNDASSPAALPVPNDPLGPTVHPPVPDRLDAMWFAPPGNPPSDGAVADLARAARLLHEAGDAQEALALLGGARVADPLLATYARFYTGVALQQLERFDAADEVFAALDEADATTVIREAALYRRAEIRERTKDYAAAVEFYEQILARDPIEPQRALTRLGAAAVEAGHRARAIPALLRVVREFPMSPEAEEADRLLEENGGFDFTSSAVVRAELARAEQLVEAGRYDLAQRVFARVRPHVGSEDEGRVELKLAQIQLARGRHAAARDVFRRYIGHDVLGREAQFGLLRAARGLGRHEEANALTEAFVARYPGDRLAEAALYEMAVQYVLDDEDGRAAEIYTRMIDRFPAGRFAERGAWKAGWWAYRQRDFAETLRIFERAAREFPRSDYRPAWLYWTARAYEQTGERQKAIERYRLTAADYRNSYYGRLAWQRLERLDAARVAPIVERAVRDASPPPPTVPIIRTLLAAGLYHAALEELQYAQKRWGDSAPLRATIAFAHNRVGNLRPGITAMRRAYPQFMAAGGENLPREVLEIIFPVAYWPLLERQARINRIDPYVLVALAAQESTFDPKIRSSAGAIGLLQIIPPTGQRLAREAGLRHFTPSLLENPEINARLGARYFAKLYREFGGYHFALAGYNAGEHRVRQWNQEAPGLPPDEWVDNIPFPETQNYVKRILGTAEDYRRLYAGLASPSSDAP